MLAVCVCDSQALQQLTVQEALRSETDDITTKH